MTTPPDTWDPERYARFAAERAKPFFDLLDLVTPIPGGRAVDLGCGPGELTAELHRCTGAAETLGIDSSDAMLAKAGTGLMGPGRTGSRNPSTGKPGNQPPNCSSGVSALLPFRSILER